MARKKITLAWIANDEKRKATFMKRKRGLLKKVSELSTLCEVEVSLMLENPYNIKKPEVWPSVPDAADTFLKFHRVPEIARTKNMTDQEGFYRQSIEKLEQQLERLQVKNKEIETDLLVYQCLGGRSLADLTMADLGDIIRNIDAKVKLVERTNFAIAGCGEEMTSSTESKVSTE